MSASEHLLDSNGVLCVGCGGRLVLDAGNGESVCTVCGMVADDDHNIVDSRAYLKSTGMNHNAVRPFTVHHTDLSTLIDYANVDVNGRQIDKRQEINKIRKLNTRVSSNNCKVKHLTKAKFELSRIVELLGVGTTVAERAWYIYRKVHKKNLVRGRPIAGLVAAAVYISCMDMDVPCSIDRIHNLVRNLKKKTFVYYCKLLLREMQMNVGSPSPSLYVSRVAKSVGLSGFTERKALDILDLAKDHEMFRGKRPLSLAAAALYLASIQNGESVTQLRIANATNLATTTIRKRCLEIMRLMDMESMQFNPVEDAGLEIQPDEVQKAIETHDADLVQLR